MLLLDKFCALTPIARQPTALYSALATSVEVFIREEMQNNPPIVVSSLPPPSTLFRWATRPTPRSCVLRSWPRRACYATRSSHPPTRFQPTAMSAGAISPRTIQVADASNSFGSVATTLPSTVYQLVVGIGTTKTAPGDSDLSRHRER